MNKILLLLILSITFFGFSDQIFAAEKTSGCIFVNDENTTVAQMLKNNCIDNTKLVQIDDATIEWGFKDKINWWTNNIALFLGILAVWSVIYGWLMMTLSAWEEEKIKKAKDIVKWGLIGFLWVVMATTIVTLVINLMYGFAT